MSTNGKGRVLVLGASGYLGSHVIRQLVGEGREVRAFARKSSNCSLTDHLDIERVYGDINDVASLQAAMKDVDVVYHCIVNPQAWKRDMTPLYKINVEGLENALKAADAAGVQRYVYTSTIATIATRSEGLSTEEDHFENLDQLPPYLQNRITAERLFFDFIDKSDMEGVAVCPSITYGGDDILPTPQGKLIWDVMRGRLPFYWTGGAESVGIEDAAEGMILAEKHGRSGERYIISERWISYEELFKTACEMAGRRPWLLPFPESLMLVSARMTEWFARRLNIDNKFNVDAIRCSNELSRVSIDKARQELGWQPRPLQESLQACVDYFKAQA